MLRHAPLRARQLRSAALALALAVPGRLLGAPVPCAGGTLDFAHGSDTPVTGTTFNVGQKVVMRAQPVGITPTAYAWTVDGPNIHDYDERVGNTFTGSVTWSTTPLAPSDVDDDTVYFYWKPDASQVHPLTGGPVARQVTLVAQVGAVTCPAVAHTFNVERSTTDVDRQAVDFYTSNHRAAAETNPQKGRIIDDHVEWHTVSGTHLYEFLPWHREFLARFDAWLAEFGYPPVEPWYPGTSIPTGPDIDHTPRFAYVPDVNRIPTWFTLAGWSTTGGGGEKRLADYGSLTLMSDALEFSWHGDVHCNVGPGGWAGMCDFSSPKDPVFWRWHKMVDVLYGNYCGTTSIACAPGPLPSSDAWIGDNAADIAAGGTPPSPAPRWVSPDVWNRTASAACTPADPRPAAVRDCGSDADHENPVEGVENYLYATVRNDRPGASLVVYLEVGIYVANASTGLAWPTDFGGPPAGVPLENTRQFITLNLAPGQVTDIGPLPWIPPSPVPSDHWCAYVRVLSVQSPLGITEGANIDWNTEQSNHIAWKNLKIVSPALGTEAERQARFIVRNVDEADAQVDLVIERPRELDLSTVIRLDLGPDLIRRWRAAGGRGENVARADSGGRNQNASPALVLTGERSVIAGIPMHAREGVGVVMTFTADRPVDKPVDVLVTQRVNGRDVGGMLFRLWDRPRRSPNDRR
jgi:hypothetical protein